MSVDDLRYPIGRWSSPDADPAGLSRVLANLVAVGWNFVLTDNLLYRNRRHRSLPGRLVVPR